MWAKRETVIQIPCTVYILWPYCFRGGDVGKSPPVHSSREGLLSKCCSIICDLVATNQRSWWLAWAKRVLSNWTTLLTHRSWASNTCLYIWRQPLSGAGFHNIQQKHAGPCRSLFLTAGHTANPCGGGVFCGCLVLSTAPCGALLS